jgi:hypothetical protein
MLSEVIVSSGGGIVLKWIEIASMAIEILAVSIIVIAIAYATIRYLYRGIMPIPSGDRYWT